MLEELLGLGFTRVELGHGIRLSLMEGVQKMVESGKVTISSLHNFCPLPVEITRASPDCYQFSSPDERERRAWSVDHCAACAQGLACDPDTHP